MKLKSLKKNHHLKSQKLDLSIIYRIVSRDLSSIAKNSLKISFHIRRYSNILRNQLVRVYTYSLLKSALRFEEYKKKNLYNKNLI
jgi:hypothetical protein